MKQRTDYIPGGICLYAPTTDLLDDYQTTAMSLIQFDTPEAQTVRGKSAVEYMHGGIVEEVAELWEPDRENIEYHRLGMVASNGGRYTDSPSLLPGKITHSAIELHQKEFGDVSWYLATRLGLQGLKLSRTIEDGIDKRIARAMNAPKCPPEFLDVTEKIATGLMLVGYGHEVERSSRAAIDDPNTTTLRRLSASAGQLIMCMNMFATANLDTTYDNILEQNITKLRRRIANNTIFDKTGGDSR